MKIISKITDYAKKSKGFRLIFVLCLSALLMVGCFFVYSSAYAKILPNISVRDIKIGGMTVEDAERELKSGFGTQIEDRIVVAECEGAQKEIRLSEFKAVIDNKKTAENAFLIGRTGGHFKKASKLFKLAFKGEEIPLEILIDEKILDSLIRELAGDKEIPAVATHYRLSGDKLTIVRGHGGKIVDRKKAVETIKKAVLDPNVEKLIFNIDMVEAQKADLESLYAEITAPMKNAEYRLEDGEVVIIPEKVGIAVEKKLIKEALDSDKPEYTLSVKTEEPERTKEELEEHLFRDVMGTWSSNFATSTQARANNVILAASRIDGKILMPGDVFSYDKTIGRRTAANGYHEAGVYIGNKVESGIGGGICQTSSALYSAALYANLEIVSRTSHSLPVSYMPAGQDATIAEGYIDLKIKNDTEYPIKISAKVTGRRLICSILGVKEPDITVELVHTRTATYEPEIERTENPVIPKGYKLITNKGAEGYAIASSRIVKKAGKIIKTEKLTRSVYRAAPQEEQVNPADRDTPSEELKIYTQGLAIPTNDPKPEDPKLEEPKTEQSVTEDPEPTTEETEIQDNTESEIDMENIDI